MEGITLPVELLETILSFAWSLPLTNEERVQLIVSSTLVSSTWKEIYQRVSSLHLHVPRTSYICHLQNRLSASVPTARILCRSISLVLDFAVSSSQDDPVLSYSRFLADLKSYNLPKLEEVSISFVNAGLPDIVQTLAFTSFPETVTKLELEWASPSTSTTASLKGPLSSMARERRGKPFLPSIRSTRIINGSAELVVMIVSACWNLVNLQISHDIRVLNNRDDGGVVWWPVAIGKGTSKNLCLAGKQMTVYHDGFIGYVTVPIWIGQLVSEKEGVKEFKRTFRRMLHA